MLVKHDLKSAAATCFLIALLALVAILTQSCQRVPAAAQTKTVTFEAAASPKAVFYCAGKTKQGERCKKHVKAAGLYCWMHQNQKPS